MSQWMRTPGCGRRRHSVGIGRGSRRRHIHLTTSLATRSPLASPEALQRFPYHARRADAASEERRSACCSGPHGGRNPSPRSRSSSSRAFADQAVIEIENVVSSRRSRPARRSQRSRCSSRQRRRGAEGDQPLDVRPADGARNADHVGSRALRCRPGLDLPSASDGSFRARRAGATPDSCSTGRPIRCGRAWFGDVACILSGRSSHSGRSGGPELQMPSGPLPGFARCLACRCCGKAKSRASWS